MKKFILVLVFLLLPGLCLADSHESSIVEMWKCKLKDGKKMEDLEANNTKWLALARKNTGNDEVNSYILSTVVGSQETFQYADIYPDMATWSAAKSAEESEEGKAIEAVFDELSDCTDNRLYKSKSS